MKNIMENELKQLGYKLINGHYCKEFGCPYDDRYIKVTYTLEDDIIFYEFEYHHLTAFKEIVVVKNKSIIRYTDALEKVGTKYIMASHPKDYRYEHTEN